MNDKWGIVFIPIAELRDFVIRDKVSREFEPVTLSIGFWPNPTKMLKVLTFVLFIYVHIANKIKFTWA